MAIGNLLAGASKIVSASVNVKADQGVAIGVLCHSSTAGTLIAYDSATTTTTLPLTGTIALVAGTYYPLPVGFGAGLYVVIGGTTSSTVFYA